MSALFRLLKKYPGQCPECSAFYPSVWEKCTVCRVPLRNSWFALLIRTLKRALRLALFISLLAAFGLLLNAIPESEKEFYVKSYRQIRAGNLHEAWENLKNHFTRQALE